MAKPDDTRAKILNAIAEHLRVHGSTKWHLVYGRWPEVFNGCEKGSAGERKFFRMIDRVKAGHGDSGKALLQEAVDKAKTAVARNLPAAPPPSYIASNGAAAEASLDFLRMLREVVYDIETLRLQTLATEKDPENEGQTRVKTNPLTGRVHVANTHVFDAMIKRRLETANTAIRIMQEIWDLQYMQDFYNGVVSIIAEEIVPAHPEIARRVMIRLQALNDMKAATPHAQPGGR